MVSDKEYWIQRAITREHESYLRGAGLSLKVFMEYEQAAKAIRKEVNDFYAKYAGKYGLSYEQAVRLLNRKEFQEWKAGLADYVAWIAKIQDDNVKKVLTAQLDALSINSSITRLEALQGQINMILNDLYEKGVAQMKAEFGDAYVEEYYKKSFDIQSRAGFYNEIAKIDAGMIETIVSYPWSGAMFSERLWQNKQALLFNTREIITQGLIQGKSISVMSKALSDKMGQSYKNAERLIRTETAHIHNEADKAAYTAAGVEEYEFMATLDFLTSEICGSLDGKHFLVKDAQTGVNFPPMHPNCRSTTVEYDPHDAMDWYNSGKPMPKRTTYQEWYDEQTAANGQGYVEAERKKAYNRVADLEQFESYTERLGSDAPADFDTFQTMKYSQPEAWAETKLFYSYKGRVPEATKKDFGLYQKIKSSGVYGTVRVPPASIDTSTLWFNADHVIDHGHSATEADAKSFIENAVFSLKRKHWTGDVFTNYYSTEGAAYVLTAENEIRTAFKRDQFKGRMKDAMEVIENGK